MAACCNGPAPSRWSEWRWQSRWAGSFRRLVPPLAEQTDTGQRTMDSRLIDMLACPVSKAPVFFSEERQLIVCPTSKLAYPIKDGIPAMLPEGAIKLEDNDPLLTRTS